MKRNTPITLVGKSKGLWAVLDLILPQPSYEDVFSILCFTYSCFYVSKHALMSAFCWGPKDWKVRLSSRGVIRLMDVYMQGRTRTTKCQQRCVHTEPSSVPCPFPLTLSHPFFCRCLSCDRRSIKILPNVNVLVWEHLGSSHRSCG